MRIFRLNDRQLLSLIVREAPSYLDDMDLYRAFVADVAALVVKHLGGRLRAVGSGSDTNDRLDISIEETDESSLLSRLYDGLFAKEKIDEEEFDFPSLYEKARELGTAAHQGLFGGVPYDEYLSAIVRVLRRFGVEPERESEMRQRQSQRLLVAAWLFNIDRTELTPARLAIEFGERIANLALAASDETGMDRRERTQEKIKQQPGALTLKLAALIAGVEACLGQGAADRQELLENYKAEYSTLREDFHFPGDHLEMWQHLDSLFSR